MPSSLPSAPAQRRSPRSRLALGVVYAALVAVAAAAVGAPPAIALAPVLATLCLLPGAALLPLVRPGRVDVEPGLVLVLSLAVALLWAQSMLWLDVWAPVPAFAALVGLCLPSVLLQLRSEARR